MITYQHVKSNKVIVMTSFAYLLNVTYKKADFFLEFPILLWTNFVCTKMYLT